MKTRSLAIAVLTLTLLAACGQRGASPETGSKPAAEPAEAANAAATASAEQAQQARDEAATAHANAERSAGYKRVLLPLFVAQYAGECSNKAGAKSHSAVTIAADGTVSAPGMKAHGIMDAGTNLTVLRAGSDGKQAPVGFMAGGEGEGWSAGNTSSTANAMLFTDKDDVLQCVDTAQTPKAQAIYPVLAQFFSAGAATLKCTDGGAIARDLKITPGSNSVTIGSDTFALVRDGAGEMAMIDAPRATMSFQIGTPDSEKVQMQLDRDGKLDTFIVTDSPSKKLYNCSAQAR